MLQQPFTVPFESIQLLPVAEDAVAQAKATFPAVPEHAYAFGLDPIDSDRFDALRWFLRSIAFVL